MTLKQNSCFLVQIENVAISHIRVGDSYIVPATSVRNLGVTIDSNLTMDCHVTAMSKAAFCSIRNIDRICKHLTQGMQLKPYPCFWYIKTRFKQFATLWHHKHTGCPTSTFAKCSCVNNHIWQITYISCACRSTLHWLPIEHKDSLQVVPHCL